MSKHVVIQCENRDQFYEVKQLLDNLNIHFKYANNTSFKIECLIEKEELQYLIRKFNVNITEL